MDDRDGPLVAKTFYQELLKDKHLDLDAVPYALDAAIQKLRREGGVGRHPNRWVPYIHIGA